MVNGERIWNICILVISCIHTTLDARFHFQHIFLSLSLPLTLLSQSSYICLWCKKNTVHIIVRYTVKIWKSWKHIIFLFATLSETFYLLDNNNSSGVFHFIWKLLYPLGFEIHATKQQDTLSINYMSLSNTFRAVHFFIPRGCYFNPSYVLISCVRMISRIG